MTFAVQHRDAALLKRLILAGAIISPTAVEAFVVASWALHQHYQKQEAAGAVVTKVVKSKTGITLPVVATNEEITPRPITPTID